VGMQEPLEDLLAQLRSAIDDAEQTGNREELARLVDELDRRLNEDDHEGIVDDLREEVTRFEAEHPRLAAAIGRAADALSALGL
jgi:polyhydroxyalkanoate synthesis regulator phasin